MILVLDILLIILALVDIIFHQDKNLTDQEESDKINEEVKDEKFQKTGKHYDNHNNSNNTVHHLPSPSTHKWKPHPHSWKNNSHYKHNPSHHPKPYAKVK